MPLMFKKTGKLHKVKSDLRRMPKFREKTTKQYGAKKKKFIEEIDTNAYSELR